MRSQPAYYEIPRIADAPRLGTHVALFPPQQETCKYAQSEEDPNGLVRMSANTLIRRLGRRNGAGLHALSCVFGGTYDGVESGSNVSGLFLGTFGGCIYEFTGITLGGC